MLWNVAPCVNVMWPIVEYRDPPQDNAGSGYARYNDLMPDPGHIPVLPDEVVELLRPQPGRVFVDGTVGRGGHGALVIPRLGPGGRYVGTDLDPRNVAFATERLGPIAAEHGVALDIVHASFADLRAVLMGLNIDRVDAVLADLGFASNQMDDPARGLSFAEDGPLDMRLDPSDPDRPTAAELVNTLPERELADVIYQYGEERFSRRIARKIVETRRESPIQTTGELARVVRGCYGPAGRRSKIHPATRTFMALRIAVNGELDALDRLLDALPQVLAPSGRAGLISFHSLEDRRVKHAFRGWSDQGWATRITRKPATPSESELSANPRSRSAKLRVVEWR